MPLRAAVECKPMRRDVYDLFFNNNQGDISNGVRQGTFLMVLDTRPSNPLTHLTEFGYYYGLM